MKKEIFERIDESISCLEDALEELACLTGSAIAMVEAFKEKYGNGRAEDVKRMFETTGHDTAMKIITALTNLRSLKMRLEPYLK